MKPDSAYIAISTVLVIMSAVVILTTAATIAAVTNLNQGTVSFQSHRTRALLEGCVSDALLYLNIQNDLTTSFVQPEITCSVTTDSHTGNDWLFTVTGTADGITKSLQIGANRTPPTLTVTSWKEI